MDNGMRAAAKIAGVLVGVPILIFALFWYAVGAAIAFVWASELLLSIAAQ